MKANWYYSHNQEYYFGPYEIREEALREGIADNPDVATYTALCTPGKFYAKVFDQGLLAEAFDEINSENSDPDDDECATDQVTEDQWSDLARVLNAAAQDWAARHKLGVWKFEDVSEEQRHEPIPAEVA